MLKQTKKDVRNKNIHSIEVAENIQDKKIKKLGKVKI